MKVSQMEFISKYVPTWRTLIFDSSQELDENKTRSILTPLLYGADGVKWIVKNRTPSHQEGHVNDYFINFKTSKTYKKDSNGWQYLTTLMTTAEQSIQTLNAVNQHKNNISLGLANFSDVLNRLNSLSNQLELAKLMLRSSSGLGSIGVSCDYSYSNYTFGKNITQHYCDTSQKTTNELLNGLDVDVLQPTVSLMGVSGFNKTITVDWALPPRLYIVTGSYVGDGELGNELFSFNIVHQNLEYANNDYIELRISLTSPVNSWEGCNLDFNVSPLTNNKVNPIEVIENLTSTNYYITLRFKGDEGILTHISPPPYVTGPSSVLWNYSSELTIPITLSTVVPLENDLSVAWETIAISPNGEGSDYVKTNGVLSWTPSDYQNENYIKNIIVTPGTSPINGHLFKIHFYDLNGGRLILGESPKPTDTSTSDILVTLSGV